MAQRRSDWVVVEDDPLSPRAATSGDQEAPSERLGAPGPSPPQPSAARGRTGHPSGAQGGAEQSAKVLKRGMRGSPRGQRGRGSPRGQRGRGLVRRGHPPPLRGAASAGSVLELAGRRQAPRSPPLKPSRGLHASTEHPSNAEEVNEPTVKPASPHARAPKGTPCVQDGGVTSRSFSDLPQYYRKAQPPGGRRLPPGLQKERSHSSPLCASSTAPHSPSRVDERPQQPPAAACPPTGSTPGGNGRAAVKGIAAPRGGRGVARGRPACPGDKQSLPLGGRKSSNMQIASPALSHRDECLSVQSSNKDLPDSTQVLVGDESKVDVVSPEATPPGIVIVECPGEPAQPQALQRREQRISGSPMPSKKPASFQEPGRSKSVEPQLRPRGALRGRGRGRGGGRGGLVFHRPATTRPGASPSTQGRKRGTPPATAGKGLMRSETAPRLSPRSHNLPNQQLDGKSPTVNGRSTSAAPRSHGLPLRPLSPRGAPRAAPTTTPPRLGQESPDGSMASKSMPEMMTVRAADLDGSLILDEESPVPLIQLDVSASPDNSCASADPPGKGCASESRVGILVEECIPEEPEEKVASLSDGDVSPSSDSTVEEEDEEEEDAPFILDLAFLPEDDAEDAAPVSEDPAVEESLDAGQMTISAGGVPSLPSSGPTRQLSQRAVGFVGKTVSGTSPMEEKARSAKEKKKALHAERRKTAQLQQYEAELMAFADDVQRSLGACDGDIPADTHESDSLESQFLSELLNLVGSTDRKASNAEERMASIDQALIMANQAAEEARQEEKLALLGGVSPAVSPPEPERKSPVRSGEAPARPARGADCVALSKDASERDEEEELMSALDAAAEDVASSCDSAPARRRKPPRTRSIVISRKLGSIDVGTFSDEASSTDATSCGSLEDASIFDMDEVEEGDGERIANDWRNSIHASRALKAFRPPFSRLRSPYFCSPKDGTPNALELRSWLEYRSRAEAMSLKSERLDTCCISLVKFVHSKELRDPLLPRSPQGVHNPFLSPETRAEDKMLDQRLQQEHMKKPPKLAFLGVPSRVNHITLRLLRDHSQSVHQVRQSVLESFVDCGKRFMLILLRCASKMGFSLMSSVKEALAKEVYNDFDGAQTPEFKMRCLVELWNSPAIKQAYSTLYGAHATADRKDEIPAISFVFERMGDIVASGFETEEKDAMVLHLASVGRVHTHRLKISENELDLVVFAELGDSQYRILPGITTAAIVYLIDLASPKLWEEILQFRRQFGQRFRRKPTLVLLTGVSSFVRLAEKPQALRRTLPLYDGEGVQSQLISYVDKQFTDGLPKVCTMFCSSTSDPVILRQISKHVAQFASNLLQKRAKARREKEKTRPNEHLGAQLRVRNPGRKAGKTISRLSMRVKGLDVRSTFSRLPTGQDA